MRAARWNRRAVWPGLIQSVKVVLIVLILVERKWCGFIKPVGTYFMSVPNANKTIASAVKTAYPLHPSRQRGPLQRGCNHWVRGCSRARKNNRGISGPLEVKGQGAQSVQPQVVSGGEPLAKAFYSRAPHSFNTAANSVRPPSMATLSGVIPCASGIDKSALACKRSRRVSLVPWSTQS
jgi:hypothetical protein